MTETTYDPESAPDAIADPRRHIEHLLAEARRIYRNEPERAYDTAAEGLRRGEAIDDTRSRALSLSVMAECRRVTGRMPEALDLAEQAAALADTLADPQTGGRTIHQLGIMVLTVGRPAEAIPLLQQAVDLLESCGGPAEALPSRNALTKAYEGVGLYEEALANALALLESLDTSSAALVRAIALLNIARIYDHFSDHDGARRHYGDALAIYRALGDRVGEAGTLMNIGVSLEQELRWQEALDYYAVALPIARDLRHPSILPMLLTSIGTVYEYQGEFTTALAYETEAIEIARSGEDELVIANVLRCLGRLQIAMGDVEGARRTLDEGLRIGEKYGDLDLLVQIHHCLADLFESTGESAAAFRHLRLHADLDERIQGREVQGRIQNLRMQHELRRHQAEKELLTKRAERLEESVAAQSMELASMALHLAHKQRSLLKLRREVGSGGGRRRKAMLRETIDSEIRSEEDWERFRRHFDTIFPEFVGKLSARFPELTPTELKICALLKVQLSSKDIADLLCISRHTVNTHRQSLRRKLGLGDRANLVSFLSGM